MDRVDGITDFTDHTDHGTPISRPPNPAVSSRLRAIARGAITTRAKGFCVGAFPLRVLDSALATLARSSGAGRHDQIMSRPPAEQPGRDTNATCRDSDRVYMKLPYDARSNDPLVSNLPD